MMNIFDRLTGGENVMSLGTVREDPGYTHIQQISIELDSQLMAQAMHLWEADEYIQVRHFAVTMVEFVQTVIEALFVSGQMAYRTGEIPKVTARMARSWAEVRSTWILNAREFAVATDPKLPRQVPFSAPAGVFDERQPAHFKALVGALEAARMFIQNIMYESKHSLPWRFQSAFMAVQQESIRPDSVTEQLTSIALGLTGRESDSMLQQQQAYAALEQYLLLAQKLSMPRLIGVNFTPPPLPFGLWALSHPQIARSWQHDSIPLARLQTFWGQDPDPEATYGIQQEIDVALNRQDIRRTDTWEQQCPWQPHYYARRNLSLAGVTVPEGAEFYYLVQPGRPYRRALQIVRLKQAPEFKMPPGVNLWFLTDPSVRQEHIFDEEYTSELKQFYQAMDTQQIKRVAERQDEVIAAKDRGALRRVTARARTTCPWQSAYRVREALCLLDIDLLPDDVIFLTASGEIDYIEHGVAAGNQRASQVAAPASSLPEDPWLLTHPAARMQKEHDHACVAMLTAFWGLPGLDQTNITAIQRILDDRRQAAVIRRKDFRPEAPWQAVYYAREALTLKGITLEEGETFYFDPVSLQLIVTE